MLKVIWIEQITRETSVQWYFHKHSLWFIIMSIMSFLMHPWYLSCASAYNRCTRRCDTAGIWGTERAAAADTGGSRGAAFRRSVRRGRRWVPGSPSLQLCERQAPEHIKPPHFQNSVTVLLLHIYIVALSLGVGCKHLLHWLSNPCPDIDTLNPM